MKALIGFVLLLCFASLFSAAQEMKPTTQANAKFAQFCDQFVKESLALSPVTASQAGYHKHPDPKTGKTIELDAQLDDVSPQGIAAQEKFYRDWRTRFQTETPVNSLNAEDGADYRLIDDQIALQLLELEKIQNYKHNPTVYIELLGNGLFLPITQNYAPQEVRVGHVIARIGQIPRFLRQAKSQLADADPIFISTAVEENEGNLNLLDTVAAQIPAGSPLKGQFDKVAPAARKALNDFNAWMKSDLAKRPTHGRTWRLGEEWYAQKFHYVLETTLEPGPLNEIAYAEMRKVRVDMLRIALPLYHQMFPGQDDYAKAELEVRENKVIGAVLNKISDEHPQRDQLMETAKVDLAEIKQFLVEHKIVTLSSRDNLKVIPTPEFMRGIYSVAGFHSAPPLEPTAEAQYWVTPIDPKAPDAMVESRLREYNNYGLKWLTLHEAMPGHYVQAEHADDVQPPSRRLLRTLFGNGAYVEGWAEYATDVVTEEGYLNHDPKFLLVRKKVWLRAIINAMLDVRLHTMDMGDQQALDLMMNQGFQTQAEAEGKLKRAKLNSTQLPTYFVGTRQWWDLRHKYQKAKGSSFSLEEFHDRALDQGPLPLEYLEKIIVPKSGS